ncbi:hypothetical protein FOA52_011862 [Chlamydomonas sp. UWO 241]|nr:hypothetical protein FOA52_011862 [Chlamydomonas sp. UWO 241]
MDLVFVAAEVAPFSKTGGLGDVMASLPVALAKRGHRVMVVSPRYLLSEKSQAMYDKAGVKDTGVRKGLDMYFDQFHEVGFHHTHKDGVDWVFVDHMSFHRPGTPYGNEHGTYADNLQRFAILSLAACEAPLVVPVKRTDGQPGMAPLGQEVVFIANDWHTGLLPLYIDRRFRPAGVFGGARCTLLLHNMAHQGAFPADTWRGVGVPDGAFGALEWREPAAGGKLEGPPEINLLKAAIVSSDLMVAVSQNYAWEISFGDAPRALPPLPGDGMDPAVGVGGGVGDGGSKWDGGSCGGWMVGRGTLEGELARLRARHDPDAPTPATRSSVAFAAAAMSAAARSLARPGAFGSAAAAAAALSARSAWRGGAGTGITPGGSLGSSGGGGAGTGIAPGSSLSSSGGSGGAGTGIALGGSLSGGGGGASSGAGARNRAAVAGVSALGGISGAAATLSDMEALCGDFLSLSGRSTRRRVAADSFVVPAVAVDRSTRDPAAAAAARVAMGRGAPETASSQAAGGSGSSAADAAQAVALHLRGRRLPADAAGGGSGHGRASSSSGAPSAPGGTPSNTVQGAAKTKPERLVLGNRDRDVPLLRSSKASASASSGLDVSAAGYERRGKDMGRGRRGGELSREEADGGMLSVTASGSGAGLGLLLREHASRLRGIVNGVDCSEWDPSTDPHLASRYSAANVIAGKTRCKLALQAELGLPLDADRPLLAFIGRLDYQKGPDLVLDAMPALVALGCQVVLLGSGAPDYEERMREAQRELPYHVRVS